jgi:hypothetical protein
MSEIMKKRAQPKRRKTTVKKQESQFPKPAQFPQIFSLSLLKRLFSSTERTIGTVAAISAIVLFLYAVFDQPLVRSIDTSSGASAVLPFEVTNKSSIFDMTKITFTCGIESAAFQDKEGHRYDVSDVILDADITLDKLAATKTISYPCDATAVLRPEIDGSLALRALKTNPGLITSDLSLVTACLWIGIKYDTLFFSRRAEPQTFAWVKTGKDHQWIKGPIVAEDKADPCANGPMPPFMRLHGPNNSPSLDFSY